MGLKWFVQWKYKIIRVWLKVDDWNDVLWILNLKVKRLLWRFFVFFYEVYYIFLKIKIIYILGRGRISVFNIFKKEKFYLN